VRAGARRPIEAARLAPCFEWVAADFADLGQASAWRPLLEEVDVVINCVGVLQDGAGDRLETAHLTGPMALISACESLPVQRLIQISAVGADAEAGTTYARTKARTEMLIAASTLDWVVLRPSLVMARNAYGGTSLMRGLAALPCIVPVVGGDQLFRPVWIDDLSEAIVRLAKPGAPSRLIIEVAGPEAIGLGDLLSRLRAWLGLKPARIVHIPQALAIPVLLAGDLLGRLGWPSALRTTSMKQMAYNVEGDAEAWTKVTGIDPTTMDDALVRNPASSADRWQAKLYFLRPLSILLLGLFWLLTGLISLGPGWNRALAILHAGGYGETSVAILVIGGLFDVAMGLALFQRRWTARIAILMAIATVGYLIAGSLSLPQLWADPMGPWLKVVPMMALCLFIAATDERR